MTLSLYDGTIRGFVLLQKYCTPITLQSYMHYANYYIAYTSIHNYYITVQNKSGYGGFKMSIRRPTSRGQARDQAVQ